MPPGRQPSVPEIAPGYPRIGSAGDRASQGDALLATMVADEKDGLIQALQAEALLADRLGIAGG
jgi:hypothetical protein